MLDSLMDDFKLMQAQASINELKAKDSTKDKVGNISDGYHTFNELYEYRLLYNAALFNELSRNLSLNVHKSTRHSEGDECFGGGWFIVMATLPTGQISNHYEMKHWNLFKIDKYDKADPWDGHTPEQAKLRLKSFILNWRR